MTDKISKQTTTERKFADQPGTKAVYEFICEYMNENNYAPTQREISEGCFLSRGTIVRYLDRLEAWGLLTREINKARSIALVEDNHRL